MKQCYIKSSPGASTWIKGMMTSSNGNIFRVTGPLCGEFSGPGEFPTQRPVTRSFDVCFDLRLIKQLSKQPWGWWFETPSWSVWRQRNGCNFSCLSLTTSKVRASMRNYIVYPYHYLCKIHFDQIGHRKGSHVLAFRPNYHLHGS